MRRCAWRATAPVARRRRSSTTVNRSRAAIRRSRAATASATAAARWSSRASASVSSGVVAAPRLWRPGSRLSSRISTSWRSAPASGANQPIGAGAGLSSSRWRALTRPPRVVRRTPRPLAAATLSSAPSASPVRAPTSCSARARRSSLPTPASTVSWGWNLIVNSSPGRRRTNSSRRTALLFRRRRAARVGVSLSDRHESVAIKAVGVVVRRWAEPDRPRCPRNSFDRQCPRPMGLRSPRPWNSPM